MRPITKNIQGAFYMVLGSAGFAFNDGVIKLTAADLSLGQIVFVQGMMVTVLFFFLFFADANFHFQYTAKDLTLIVLRAIAEVATAAFFLTALIKTPIFLLTAILQSAPLMFTIVAAVFFREVVGFRRWSATCIGLCGVLLIIQPGVGGVGEPAILGLLATVCIVLRDCLTRMLSEDVSSSLTGFVSSLFLTICGGLACILLPSVRDAWVPLLEIPHWDFLFAAAGLLFCGCLCSIAAMRQGDVGFVSPFRYTGMIWVAAIGYYIFNDPFDSLALVGVAIVLSSSVYTIVRENRVK